MNISFLLAAGFSKPAGYPLAYEVSNLLLRVKASGIATHTSGDAWLRDDFISYLKTGSSSPYEPPADGFRWARWAGANALEAILEVYGQQHDLSNYEDFYDELMEYRRGEPTRLAAPAFLEAYEKRQLHANPQQVGNERHIEQAINEAHNIFVQLLEGAIKPDQAAVSPDASEAYGKFVQFLRTYGQPSRDWSATPTTKHQFFIHTLNHDLFFEGLLNDESYNGALDYSDGFEELGSPYYGRLEFGSEFPPRFKEWPPYAYVRIPRYTGRYTGPIQLVKLHGSLDYYGFGVERNDKGLYEPQVLKKQPWLYHLDLYREIEKNGIKEYRNDFTNYHSLFLSGTTTKMTQYDDPILFKRLLSSFEQNLFQSDLLIIIGYGFRDLGINERILPFLENPSKQTIVIGRQMPTWFTAVQSNMFRDGGLEKFDYAELEKLLTS